MVSNDEWLQRWSEGRTAWHEQDGSLALREHWCSKARTVLVPFCGKSVDMIWLAKNGHEVVGVELAEKAIDEFFAEHGLERTVTQGAVTVHQATELPITIHCGDYYEVEGLQCEALYDRGALVAVAGDSRQGYVAHTDSLLVADPDRLVITLEYDQALVDGPPFAVLADEVLGYWSNLERVFARDAIDDVPPKFRQGGVERVDEVVWRTPDP